MTERRIPVEFKGNLTERQAFELLDLVRSWQGAEQRREIRSRLRRLRRQRHG